VADVQFVGQAQPDVTVDARTGVATGEQANAKRDLLNAKWQYFFDGNAVEYARVKRALRCASAVVAESTQAGMASTRLEH